jgi:glucose-1-phosphate thymidylyltransferase
LGTVKALILAGGAGTRLRPITHTNAKQLVPVANKPILFYGLEAMAEAGIKEIGMIVGDTAAEVREAVGDGSRWGLDITYLPQAAPLGLAHCVLIAREFLAADDFVMYLGDNLIRQGVKEFVDRFESERRQFDPAVAHILLARVPDPHRFGVAELDDAGEVVRLVEKPVEPKSDLALVGVYLFSAAIHEAVAAIEPSPRGELEITDAIQWLVDHGHRVRSDLLEGWWIDTGKLTPLLEANRLILETLERRIDGDVDEESRIEGRVVIEAGAVVMRSQIRGPAIIGARSRILDSFIGPFTAIDHDCQILFSEVEHSVILARSRVDHVGRLEASLLGRDVEVTRSGLLPRATRLMVGDDSQIDLT